MSVSNFSYPLTTTHSSTIPGVAQAFASQPERHEGSVEVFQVQEKTLPYVFGERVIGPMINRVLEGVHLFFSSMNRAFSLPVAQAQDLTYLLPELDGTGQLKRSTELADRAFSIIAGRRIEVDPTQLVPLPDMPQLPGIVVETKPDQAKAIVESAGALGQAQVSVIAAQNELLAFHNTFSNALAKEVELLNQEGSQISGKINGIADGAVGSLKDINRSRSASLSALTECAREVLSENQAVKDKANQILDQILALTREGDAAKVNVLFDLYKQKMNVEYGRLGCLNRLKVEEEYRHQLANNSLAEAGQAIALYSGEREALYQNFVSRVNVLSSVTKEQQAAMIKAYEAFVDQEQKLFSNYLEIRRRISQEKDEDFKRQLEARSQAIELYIATLNAQLEAEKALREQRRLDVQKEHEMNMERGNLLIEVVEKVGKFAAKAGKFLGS